MKLQTIVREDLKYSTEAIATDQELSYQIQVLLTTLGLLNPPIDSQFGPLSAASLKQFQALMKCQETGFLGADTAQMLIETKPEGIPRPALKPPSILAGRIIKYMLAKHYYIDTGEREYNIVYVAGINADGTRNSNAPGEFNDRRIVIEVKDGVPIILGNWDATIEPSQHNAHNSVRSGEAAKIEFGQHRAWQVGIHGFAEPHEALVQVVPLNPYQEFNRVGDFVDTRLNFRIDQHYGFDFPRNDICMASAGSLVGRTRSGHREFMQLLKQDKRYLANPDYIFTTTVIPGSELMAMFPA